MVAVALRVDASTATGTGHAMRCLALAEGLRERGADVHFICRDHPGNLAALLERCSMPCTLLPRPSAVLKEAGDDAASLGATEIEDAEQTIAALAGRRPDWLIADHYGIGSAWERRLDGYANRLLIVDDLANRGHVCDMLLDQNHLHPIDERYRGLVPVACRLLLGPRYALLRTEFAAAISAPAARAGRQARVFVYFGGSDRDNMTGRTLDALMEPRFRDLQVDIVLGANHAHGASIRHQAAARPGTRVHDSMPELASLMTGADLAIGAGGITTWERLCLGVPSLVIAIADNQVPSCQALAADGMINYLGMQERISAADIRAALQACLADKQRLRQQVLRGQALVDGHGTARVVEQLLPSAIAALRLRPASAKDAWLYFGWVNDPESRSHSLRTTPVCLDEHLAWFATKLESTGSHMFVLEAARLPVGQVRFDEAPDGSVISYSLDRDVRGRGWAKRLVELGLEAMRLHGPAEVRATVKSANPASEAVLRGLGFEEVAGAADAGRRSYRLRIAPSRSSRHAD